MSENADAEMARLVDDGPFPMKEALAPHGEDEPEPGALTLALRSIDERITRIEDALGITESTPATVEWARRFWEDV